MPADVADALRARAGELGCTVGETVARLLGVGGPLPQPAAPTADLVVNERRPTAPPPSSQATGFGGSRCRCKSPTMSKVVTNICTACGLIRRP